MSENLSSGYGGENLVSTPPRQSRPAPSPRRSDAPEERRKDGPITSDDMKLKKKVTVNKPLTFKTNKKKD